MRHANTAASNRTVERSLHAAADEVRSEEAKGQADAGQDETFADDEGNDVFNLPSALSPSPLAELLGDA
jgi:hypothetical protein